MPELLLLEASLLESWAEELDPDDGVLDDDEDGALEVEPAPAEPLMPLELGLDDEDDEDAPPLAWSFLLMSTLVDEELEPDGAVLGEVVEPDEDVDALPEGEAVEPEGARSVVLRLQPVTSAVPRARVTARANVDTFMGPPWLGVQKNWQQISGRVC